ncbi:molybdenum cofactor biosynthesis protein MoeA [Streptomyces sp. NRRL F-4489]|uniref:molybdopterin molybdotransferase MoeA n=1 Tax=Streptomyces sp. NRRL F-4489 TaxID=1609095 RepID=UPI0007498D16|nr:molybdopterin molybdotransferase MoeA [Streptomyces sp. NRRL F-4489]KUL35981.1 molybdenum cofactor biosynthesis protein MoeA [Streptomyces sp. NRRL F-4489]
MTDGEHGDRFGDEFADALALANDTAPRRAPGATAAGTDGTTATGTYAAYGAGPDDPHDPHPSGGPAPGGPTPEHPAGPAAGASDGTGRQARAGHRATAPSAAAPASARTGAPHHRTTPWPAARDLAAHAVDGPPGPGTAPLGEALGRTLAAPLTALTDLPSFDTSAMDGWAVAGPGPWRVDRVAADDDATGPDHGLLAGHSADAALVDGHAVPIATGARVPPGATAVLRSEHGEILELPDGRARLYTPRPVSPGQDIRPRGQECRTGDHLLPADALVTPAVLGLAAAAGYDELSVHPRPRVEVFVLGDELLRSGRPEGGRIRDALGPMLVPWLRALGAEMAPPRHLADDAELLHEALAGSTADLVVTTGGTAAGPVDHLHPTLRRMGAELLVDGVAVRPGHPMLLARLAPRRHLVGLPGNPLAAVSGLLTLAEPLLRTLAARRPAEPYRVPLAAAVQGHPRDTRLVPVAYRDDDRHGLIAAPLRFHGPAMLRGIAAADALAVVPPGGAERGTEAELLELPWPAGWSAGWPAPGTGYDSASGGPA